MKEPVRRLLAVNSAEMQSPDLDSQLLQAEMTSEDFKDFSNKPAIKVRTNNRSKFYSRLYCLYMSFFFNAKSDSKRVLNKI